MTTVADVARLLDALAPSELAEDWDNVGLLVGDRQRSAARVMTCLTLTAGVADEAIGHQVDLIVTHHPLPFRPLERLTTDTTEGRVLWRLAEAGVSVYSPHTAFDSAAEGINAQLAEGLALANVSPLVPADPENATAAIGAGRIGATLASTTLHQFATQTAELLRVDYVRVVSSNDHPINRVAVACGSGGSLLDAAIESGADVLVTGEATFHTLLAAEAAGLAVVLVGHYASERFALEWLAEWLAGRLDGVEVWASRQERDPLRLVPSALPEGSPE